MGKKNRAHFSLLEIMVAIFILSVAVFGLLSLIMSTMVLNKDSYETNLANNAIRAKLEEIKGSDFKAIYAKYNRQSFAVSGLNPISPATDVIFIHFYVGEEGIDDGHPFSPKALTPELRKKLGFPNPPVEGQGLDLDGNGAIIGSASLEYVLLPTRIQLRWQGLSGIRTIELYCILNDF